MRLAHLCADGSDELGRREVIQQTKRGDPCPQAVLDLDARFPTRRRDAKQVVPDPQLVVGHSVQLDFFAKLVSLDTRDDGHAVFFGHHGNHGCARAAVQRPVRMEGGGAEEDEGGSRDEVRGLGEEDVGAVQAGRRERVEERAT